MTTPAFGPDELAAWKFDPLRCIARLWPRIRLYDKEEEILQSLVADDETVVVAGNMLGKDFTAALAALWFFLTRDPCRVVASSVDGHQLEAVFFGELNRFIQECSVPLDERHGGPLVVNHLHVRKRFTDGPLKGEVCGLSYIRGRTAKKGEGLLGHHVGLFPDRLPRTLFIGDEASGLEDVVKERTDTWAKRTLIIGNPFPCTNFFRQAERKGSLTDPAAPGRYHVNLIRITAEDSPNVRLAREEQRAGLEPSDTIIVPGVLSWGEYQKRRSLWDPVRQCVSLDARWWEGSDALMYPPDWLNRSHRLARALTSKMAGRIGRRRTGRAMGVDPAEGGDKSSWAVVDEEGVLELLTRTTPDTTMVPAITRHLMTKWQVPPEKVMFDRGGGGKQHADRLRQQGYPVQTVAFGSSVQAPPHTGATIMEHAEEVRERAYTYLNVRALMYDLVRQLLDPAGAPRPTLAARHGDDGDGDGEEQGGWDGRDQVPMGEVWATLEETLGVDVRGIEGWAIPEEYTELRRQMALIPLTFDPEGRLYLLPKQKRNPNDTRRTLTEILGRSPDELDSLALAVYGMCQEAWEPAAGAL